MISSQAHHYVAGFDELVQPGDSDYAGTGLKVPSVIRVGRLAVVADDILLGAMGHVSKERLARIKKRLADWLAGD